MGNRFKTYQQAYRFKKARYNPKDWEIIHRGAYYYVIHKNDVDEWEREMPF